MWMGKTRRGALRQLLSLGGAVAATVVSAGCGRERRWATTPLAMPADDVLNDREVDAPARAQPEGSVEFADAEDGVPDAQGEHLCAGTECQCVRACHPCPVAGDVAAADRVEPQNNAGGHARPEREPERVGQVPAPR